MTRPTSSADRDAGRDLLFDASVRARHAEALQRLSPRVQAQLAQRRNAALRGQPAAARRAHRLHFAAAGFATLCALALGLHFQPGPSEAPGALPPAVTTAATAPTHKTTRAPSTLLDEDPEFYAWLGSSDARRVAME
ncbi:hypothetical protein [Thermomonas haemolytica]|uniref:DUF3619 family protein n=1 Tax=Thermomonas haemolytica TaxID=141949 RepID=A0A4R3N5G2_9GAMM|nr:hypothetical protein [Thermomonas haemolytica]TCT23521.1 hypothetical protein EDC34_105111 [Thermomonas haemolytica]TNY30394.1 hypothetical protein BV505_00045 [Thermomonas haemolytica]